MRIRPIRLIQLVVSVVLVLAFLAFFSSDDDIVIPQGGKVIKNIKSFMGTDERKKWDPFGLGIPSDTEMRENIIFKADSHNRGSAPEKTCKPILNFAFVKTHKAGSTTLISILQRFGFTHQLKFALPKRGDVFLGWPYSLQPQKHVLPNDDQTMNFNLLVNHAVFNKTVISQLIPDNPKFIGVVRYPLTHFKSVMNYFQKMLTPADEKDKYTMMERIVRFADKPHYYDGFNDKMKNTTDPLFHVRSVTRNFQSADFGLRHTEMSDPAKVKAFMDGLHESFPFLLVMEYMHESLLLLKRRWCWELEDIMFLQKNVFKYQNKADPIPSDTASKLLDWMSIDLELYHWANKTLWTEIAKEEDFEAELTFYKSINNLVGAFCKADVFLLRQQGLNGKYKIPPLEIAASKWTQSLTIELEDCKDLMRFEMAFTRLLQIQQRPDMFDEEYYFKGPDGILKFVKHEPTKSAADVRAKFMSAKRFKFVPPHSATKKNDYDYVTVKS